MTRGRFFLLAAMFAALTPGCAGEPAPNATALADAPDESFRRGAITINYRAIGAGEPILLLHGYGDNLKMWVGIADSLARDHRVYAVDARGFGKSSKPAGVENYGTRMIDDLVAFLDHAGVPQVHVVGYSMGAMIGSTFTLSHPERVRTVTLAAGVYHKDLAALRAMNGPWIDDLEHGRRLTRLIQQVVPVLPDSEARAFSDLIFAESDSAALVDALKGIEEVSIDWAQVDAASTPAVAIVGLDDPLHPYSRALAARWPEAKLVEIPATDHMTIVTSARLLEEVRRLTRANPIGRASSRRPG